MMIDWITILVTAVSTWSIFVAGLTLHMVFYVKKVRGGSCRKTDRLIGTITAAVTLVPFLIMFTHPTWLYSTPCAVTVLYLGVAVALLYLTDLQWKNWVKLKRTHPLTDKR